MTTILTKTIFAMIALKIHRTKWMKKMNKIYGGQSFPFVTPLSFPMVKWLVWAIMLTPIAIVIGIVALIWHFV
jgi:hypothetical protein